MTGFESALTNAVAPTIIVFILIGYIQKRDIALEKVLHDISKSNNELQKAIREQKQAIEKMYVELITKTRQLEEFKNKQ